MRLVSALCLNLLSIIVVACGGSDATPTSAAVPTRVAQSTLAAPTATQFAANPGSVRRASEPSPDYVPPDPQEIADATLALVNTPPGQRPLRVVVGPVFTTGVAEYNALYERARDELAESLTRPDQAITWVRR